MLAALLTTILFATSSVTGHRSATRIGGMEANFWRVVVATVLLTAWAVTLGQGFAGRGAGMFVLSGVVGIGLGDLAWFQAMLRLGPRLSVLLAQCLTAPLGALIEWLWLDTRLSGSQMACIGLILAGVVVALIGGGSRKRDRTSLHEGILFCALAALGGAGGAVLSRRAYAVLADAGERIDPGTAGFQRVVGGLVLSIATFLFIKWAVTQRENRSLRAELAGMGERLRSVWPWVLANSLAGQTLGVTAMQWALETTPSGIVLAVVSLTPLVVVPFAWKMEGDKPTWRSLAGSAIGVAGVIGLATSRLRGP